MPDKLACFKAYDIRGRVPEDLNEELAYKIGRAYAAVVQPRGPVAVGRDIRETSAPLAAELIRGLNEGGADTRDIGLCGTEMVYFAASRQGMGGGIMVTASHNPIEYNGMKIVREQAIPMSSESGLGEIEAKVLSADFGPEPSKQGENVEENVVDAYVDRILSFVNARSLKPLKVVINGGNGCAGPFADEIVKHLPFDIVRVHHEPDSSFPNGIPNPLLEENRPPTSNAVTQNKAHLGVAWDGDFDRCFLFDEKGNFIEGYYIVGLLGERAIKLDPGGKVVHDPRLTWNTIEMVKEAGGVPIESVTGHAFIKERMRKENAVYGGEMSAHHYFRDFAFCDSGMVPWLLVAESMCEQDRSLSDLVEERMAKYPCSGEINNRVEDPDAIIEKVRKHFEPANPTVKEIDGLSMEFGDQWRFNIRKSQTEPILRLNVEANRNEDLMREKTDEILGLIQS